MHPDLPLRRREYAEAGLDPSDVAPTWHDQLGRWMLEADNLAEPNAMVLSTATAEGRPSSRTVLLKGYDQAGLVFFTNKRSRKARELSQNAHASALLPWHELQRQVLFAGQVSAVDDSVSDAYFALRPRQAQLGAWASPQSEVLGSRTELLEKLAGVAARFGDDPIPRPPHWGGYLLDPDAVEFWQGRSGRLHDRVRYRSTGEAWILERLAP